MRWILQVSDEKPTFCIKNCWDATLIVFEKAERRNVEHVFQEPVYELFNMVSILVLAHLRIELNELLFI